MKTLGQLVLTITLIATEATAAESPIAGTWQGTVKHAPAATLLVKEDGGKLSGTAVFYVVRWDNDGDADDGPEIIFRDKRDLINPKFDGKTFSFRLKNPDGALVNFQMEVKRKNEGELKIVGKEGSPLKMIRASKTATRP